MSAQQNASCRAREHAAGQRLRGDEGAGTMTQLDDALVLELAVRRDSCMHRTGARGAEDRSAILQGTLDLMVLKTLDATKWGTSENNRRAKFYSLTKAGRKQLAAEADNWERLADVIGRLLQTRHARVARC